MSAPRPAGAGRATAGLVRRLRGNRVISANRNRQHYGGTCRLRIRRNEQERWRTLPDGIDSQFPDDEADRGTDHPVTALYHAPPTAAFSTAHHDGLSVRARANRKGAVAAMYRVIASLSRLIQDHYELAVAGAATVVGVAAVAAAVLLFQPGGTPGRSAQAAVRGAPAFPAPANRPAASGPPQPVRRLSPSPGNQSPNPRLTGTPAPSRQPGPPPSPGPSRSPGPPPPPRPSPSPRPSRTPNPWPSPRPSRSPSPSPSPRPSPSQVCVWLFGIRVCI